MKNSHIGQGSVRPPSSSAPAQLPTEDQILPAPTARTGRATLPGPLAELFELAERAPAAGSSSGAAPASRLRNSLGVTTRIHKEQKARIVRQAEQLKQKLMELAERNAIEAKLWRQFDDLDFEGMDFNVVHRFFSDNSVRVGEVLVDGIWEGGKNVYPMQKYNIEIQKIICKNIVSLMPILDAHRNPTPVSAEQMKIKYAAAVNELRAKVFVLDYQEQDERVKLEKENLVARVMSQYSMNVEHGYSRSVKGGSAIGFEKTFDSSGKLCGQVEHYKNKIDSELRVNSDMPLELDSNLKTKIKAAATLLYVSTDRSSAVLNDIRVTIEEYKIRFATLGLSSAVNALNQIGGELQCVFATDYSTLVGWFDELKSLPKEYNDPDENIQNLPEVIEDTIDDARAENIEITPAVLVMALLSMTSHFQEGLLFALGKIQPAVNTMKLHGLNLDKYFNMNASGPVYSQPEGVSTFKDNWAEACNDALNIISITHSDKPELVERAKVQMYAAAYSSLDKLNLDAATDSVFIANQALSRLNQPLIVRVFTLTGPSEYAWEGESEPEGVPGQAN
jgi:hypothetical protein